MKYSDQDLERLLARGRLSGATRERILARALDQAAPSPARRRVRLISLIALTLAVGSTAVVLLVARPRLDDGQWGAKGSGAQAAVALDARCSEQAVCRAGSTIVFSAFGARGDGYLGAYAQPVAGGERIWYFSAETDAPLVAASARSTQPAGRGVVVGAEHRPGVYQVHLFLSSAPLTQAVLLAGDDPRILARAVVPLTVAGP